MNLYNKMQWRRNYLLQKTKTMDNQIQH